MKYDNHYFDFRSIFTNLESLRVELGVPIGLELPDSTLFSLPSTTFGNFLSASKYKCV